LIKPKSEKKQIFVSHKNQATQYFFAKYITGAGGRVQGAGCRGQGAGGRVQGFVLSLRIFFICERFSKTDAQVSDLETLSHFQEIFWAGIMSRPYRALPMV
jgi:hypothetical protein